MSQFYEIMTVLSPQENEDGVQAIVGGLRQQIGQSGGEVLAVDVWGKRKLAYPIKKFEEGTYVLIHCEGPTNLAADFRQHTRIRESILREMVVKLDAAHEAVVRAELEEKGPEDDDTAAAQLAAAEQRAAEKLAQVTAPVTDAAAAAGVEVVAASELEAPVQEEAAAEEPAAEEPAEEPVEAAPADEAPAADDEAPAEEAVADDAGDEAGDDAADSDDSSDEEE